MEGFVSRHAEAVIGTLCGFDRLVFRGTLRRLAVVAGLRSYLWASGVLLKDFAAHASGLSARLKAASQARCERTGRPLRYLASSALSKEQVARAIAAQDGVERGLICVLSAVEPCLSYEIARERSSRRLVLTPRRRKCLHLYHYMLDPEFGFMHARIQTWFPFQVQVCVNGREWLARQMDAAGLRYLRRDNGFLWLEDATRAQALMDRQVRAAWQPRLDRIAGQLNPDHAAMFRHFPQDYYWSTHQSEWASDILFRDRASLGRLYPKLVQHGITSFGSAEVLRFLGRKVPIGGRPSANLKAEVLSDLAARPEGVRLKHRLGANSIKMYDKQERVLRIETTINDAAGFKAFRRPEGKPNAPRGWKRLRKGIADLNRRAQLSQAANERYLDALASVADTTALGELTARLGQPAKRRGRRARPINPCAPDDAALIRAIGRGEFAIQGLRNRDLRRLLYGDAATPEARRRQAAQVTRKLALLRAHRLIRKIPRTHRYLLTDTGRRRVTALIAAHNASVDAITSLAA